jgi:hypothetical protein
MGYAQMIGVQPQVQPMQQGGVGISPTEQAQPQVQAQAPPTMAGGAPSSGALSEIPINQ